MPAVASLFIVAEAPTFAAWRSVRRRRDDAPKPFPQESLIDRLAPVGDAPIKLVVREQDVQQFAGTQPVPLTKGAADAQEQCHEGSSF